MRLRVRVPVRGGYPSPVPRPFSLICLLALACADPSGPRTGDPYGFVIVHHGDALFSWDPASHTAADSLVLPAGDSIPVEFRFFDEHGDPFVPSAAELFVLPGHFDLFKWRPDESSDFEGSFVTIDADTTSVVRVQLTRREEILLSTGYVGVRLSP